MNKYDLTLILKSSEGFETKLEKFVKENGGRVLKYQSMGKKQLAYKINKVSEAEYVSVVMEAPSEAVALVSRKLSIDKDVVRHLMLVS